MIPRPEPSEYVEYYQVYTKRVPDGDILEILAENFGKTNRLLAEIGEERAGYRYAPDKWSIKQVVGHVSDIERVFAYRALIFARGDKTPQAGVEQDDLVVAANFDERTLEDIAEEFQTVRDATLSLFENLNEETLTRVGTASGFEFSVRSIPYIIAGHEIHHMGVIRERYLK